jgi:hypothetical protein
VTELLREHGRDFGAEVGRNYQEAEQRVERDKAHDNKVQCSEPAHPWSTARGWRQDRLCLRASLRRVVVGARFHFALSDDTAVTSNAQVLLKIILPRFLCLTVTGPTRRAPSLIVEKQPCHAGELGETVPGTAPLQLCTMAFALMVLDSCIKNRPTVRAA